VVIERRSVIERPIIERRSVIERPIIERRSVIERLIIERRSGEERRWAAGPRAHGARLVPPRGIVFVY